MEHLVTYIKDLLNDDNIKVETKDGLYIITQTIVLKNSNKYGDAYNFLKLSLKLKSENVLKTYLPHESFKFYLKIINPPKPNFEIRTPSDYYSHLKGGAELANISDTFINIHMNTENIPNTWDEEKYQQVIDSIEIKNGEIDNYTI